MAILVLVLSSASASAAIRGHVGLCGLFYTVFEGCRVFKTLAAGSTPS
jgi:hypothetical protein